MLRFAKVSHILGSIEVIGYGKIIEILSKMSLNVPETSVNVEIERLINIMKNSLNC